jgi:threonine/homoserine/homoserine lactone efflux protein
MSFIKGYITGLALIILIGPVLFILLKASLERGTKAGLSVAFGIFVSDIIAVTLCMAGFSRLFQNPEFQKWIAIIGGFIVAILGIKYIIRPGIPTSAASKKISNKTLLTAFVQGFLINFVNPFVFMVWMGIITSASMSYGYSTSLYIFLSGTLLGILTLDVSKVFLAARLSSFLQTRNLNKAFQASGLILTILGIRMTYYGITL